MPRRTSLSQFKTNPDAAKSGVWINYVTGEACTEPHETDLCLKIARIGNPQYQAALLKNSKTATRQGNVQLETAEALVRRAVADHILLDWRNLYEDDDADEPVPYSRQKCRALLDDPAYIDFYETVVTFAREQAFFRLEADRDDFREFEGSA